MNPLVTAIIPVFNGELFVRDAIESVLSQTYPRIECVVIDDGSSDNTHSVLEEFSSDVKVVRQENQGVARARNRGVEAGSGDLFAFLDADDLWLPRKIETQVEMLADSHALGLSYTSLHLVDERLTFIGRVRCAASNVALRNTLLLEKPFMTGIGSSGVLPRKIFLETGGFDENLSTSADLDLACRVACIHPVSGVDQPLTLYRSHPGQMHADPLRTELEVRTVFDKLFSSGLIPEDLRSLRRRAEANLDISLAGSYLIAGNRRKFFSHATRALVRRPDRVLAAIHRLSLPDAGVSRAQ